MRLGVSPFASSRAGFERVAAAAVDGGLDTLWLGDGYLQSDAFPLWAGGLEPMAALGWLAGRFPAARIGVSAAVLPLRDPAWLVKQAATLDQLTEGRFTLALCAGFWDHELAHRGRPAADRARAFVDGLEEVRRALSAPPGDDQLSPPVLTPGGPRIWLAGGEATLRRALRMGLPYQASRLTPDELAPLARRWFDEGGGLLAHRVRVEVGAAPAEGHGVDWHAVIGSAGFVAEQLARYRELGVGDLSLVPGQDDATSLATVSALVEDVLPRLG